ncbi:MAG: S53 family peptidase [Actinobacteria bacterium]|nr:S53 family peptidase [Actinomycetota bacterium]MCL5447057.1 S53 family peptidase [Actinomycetota bacterium]
MRTLGCSISVVALAMALGAAGTGIPASWPDSPIQPAVARTPGSAMVPISQSAVPLPAGARVVGTAPGSARLDVTVSLFPHNGGGLARLVSEVSTPGTPYYRHYLSVSQFARRFGAPSQVAGAVLKMLRAFGLHPGSLSPDGLSIPVSTTIAKASSAFHVPIDLVRLRNRQVVRFAAGHPEVPYALQSTIQGIMGLSSMSTPKPQLRVVSRSGYPGRAQSVYLNLLPRPYATTTAYPPRPYAATSYPPRPYAATSYPPQACSSASSLGGLTPQELAQGYDLGPVYQSGGSGAGQTVGLVELGSFSSANISTYESCYGISTKVNAISVDGGSSFNADTNEATSDVENIIGMVPAATVDVYEAPNTDTGYYDALRSAVDANIAKVINISYGNCEQAVGQSQAQAEKTLFEQAAVQGQTVLAAAGDSGSAGCYVPGSSTPDTALAVDDPASDPYVTGVGGTDLSSLTSPRTESVWNSHNGEGGGGGISKFWSMPSWQSAPGVVNKYSSGAPCSAASGLCREVPDVSANAQVGYSMYCTAGGCNNAGWELIAGTSMATPVWASVVTMANQLCAAGPVGFLNPVLYKLATDDSGAFYDITSGNNDATGTNHGLYPATTGYDMASGIGTPNGADLVPALCSAASTTGAAASTYHPVTPVRVCDTRPGNPSGLSGTALTQCEGKTLGPAGVLTLDVSGISGIPSGATMIYLNVTAVGATQPTYLTVYPAGMPRPVVSSVNASSSAAVPNFVAISLPVSGAYAGKVSIYNNTGYVNVVVDVEGYGEYPSAPSSGGRYVPLAAPARMVDTRCSMLAYKSAHQSYCANLPLSDAGLGMIPANQSDSVHVGGIDGIPASASAVVFNLTVASPSSEGYFTMYPAGVSRPTTSNLNWVTDETRANQVVVPLGSNGEVTIYSSASTNAVLDVYGYFTGASSTTGGADGVAINPVRICDTRSGNPSNLSGSQAQCNGHTLASDKEIAVKVLGVGGVPSSGVSAVMLNLTALGGTAQGYLSVDPSSILPQSSNINWDPGATVPNFAIAMPDSSGYITIYDGSAGSVNILVDVYGYFTTS